MKIDAIQLKHTLHFTDLKLKFNDQPITLIMGDQGTGKTTILKFTYQALTWFAARYKDLRAAGVVMLDQDIMLTRLQSKIDIQVHIPNDIGRLTESSEVPDQALCYCDWQLYKTLNSHGIGSSKAETQQLENVVELYQNAIKHDQLQGLPLIAYYPAERFVNEMNILSKNNPLIFQSAHAYEISAIPFTTFSRFFEWLREVSDIENAQIAQLFQQLLCNPSLQKNKEPDFLQHLLHAQKQMHSPHLDALKQALTTVIPALEDLFIQYQPKLQLMVRYQGKSMLYQQLSNSVKNWIALVGDIVRRLCLLNPNSLYPCLEGDGILLIDAIDHQLDQNTAQVILPRLHQAFPRLQIIATGNRSELLEHAAEYQCLKIENKQIFDMQLQPLQDKFDRIYENLAFNDEVMETDRLLEPVLDNVTPQSLWQHIQQHLSLEQQNELLGLMNAQNDTSSQQSLP
ncbi:AAA family ATPase [Acinetobacter bohemicus]|uniref:Predicted ATP-binding protein involved in virulence n=1 Tax=Acinetobacter bohemicus TaxID=1435036 RepID=A0A1I6PS97_9GAMM|nr:AAA family ATPase [Acinetobacter bohemicus]KAB0654581.1 AAA family ATPase [Acinetobacter bohemicus]SFS42958.1 Predicted ATP-binding protein involved in virulence [Acinetobacter bohemicus]